MARIIQRSNNIGKRLAAIKAKLATVPNKAHAKFVDETPYRSGNARRNTFLRKGTVISAEYDYAVRLDNGYSDKAPDGMVRPTLRYIKNLVKSILG